ncbi:MAG: carboxypeptidase-like regulatory domain-containing protein [Candidatus Sulfotelmatobacter sp.]
MKPAKALTTRLSCLLSTFALLGGAAAQRDQTPDPTAAMSFLVIKDDNGKPIRNAAVIMHEVNSHGKQSRGGLELKTDAYGKTSYDDVPYGTLRVQVLAPGFQTFGQDYAVNQAKMALTIKLKRPQPQYSTYGDQPAEKNDGKAPSPDPNAKPQ